MPQHKYVHGYSEREKARLHDQADTLAGLLHHDSCFPPGSTVLEAGCGVGAQTVYLARNSPQARIISIDISPVSLEKAQAIVEKEGIANARFQTADLFDLPFANASFDHVFVCFVLEHLKEPVRALEKLRTVLKPGGTITVIEGDHGSTFFYPESEAAMETVRCLVEVQARMGGNALIGRQLYPLLQASGFPDAQVTPRMVYVDGSKPSWIEGFTENTFTAMVEGVQAQALAMGLIQPERWRRGIADLHRTAASDGVFCYTFFKATAVKL
jgi:ubiquinone/menaquinone biosynthesis C-methylase UbiE